MKGQTLPDTNFKNIAESYGKIKASSILKAILTRKNFLLVLISFLMGRASLLDGLMPFGFALFAAATGLGLNRLVIAMGLVLGMLTVQAGEQLYISMFAMILFIAFGFVFNLNDSKAKLKHAIAAFFSVAVPGIATVYLEGFLMYDLMRLVLYDSLVFCLVFIFKYSLRALTDISGYGLFTSEELISMAITVALLLSGVNNISIAGISVRNALSIFIILVLSNKCGAGAGASIGVAIGLIISISSPAAPVIIGVYAFCGLLSGIFRNMGKIGSILGFVFGNAILTFHINGSTEVLIHIKEILAGAFLFLIIPQKYLEVFSGLYRKTAADFGEDKRDGGKRIKEMTVHKLRNFSRAFKCLAKTYEEVAETKTVSSKQNISILLDNIAAKVCKGCNSCKYCWDSNFYSTYQSFFQMVEKLEASGWVGIEDMPETLSKNCERLNTLLNEANSCYEVFKVDAVWKNKVNEIREIISQQLNGLSGLIKGLATEVNSDEVFRGDLECLISENLSEAGIIVDEVVVLINKTNRYEVRITHKGCKGRRDCINIIEKNVTKILGSKMKKEQSKCYRKDGKCFLKLVEEELLNITVGVAAIPKDGKLQSGDCYTFLNTGEGKFIAALSDGMGTGYGAETESNIVINLLEELVDSGFDVDTTVNMINSILLVKSDKDNFATIDLTVVDLHSGETEFVKVGAAPTFVKKNENVRIIRRVSLPAGILSNVETELMRHTVKSGDFIIMMTDGVYDSFDEAENNSTTIMDYLSMISTRNPQEMADNILNKAIHNNQDRPRDDMLVLVAKVWSRLG
ncbi:MAG TPA: stage II sporulation protein E [Clostridiaceae bacterium]|jgi:stage II sporulation protein E|nr:stage II sporulation protein E [Clostridiaceae bacterium]